MIVAGLVTKMSLKVVRDVPGYEGGTDSVSLEPIFLSVDRSNQLSFPVVQHGKVYGGRDFVDTEFPGRTNINDFVKSACQ